MFKLKAVKGALRSFGGEMQTMRFNIYNNYEVIIVSEVFTFNKLV